MGIFYALACRYNSGVSYPRDASVMGVSVLTYDFSSGKEDAPLLLCPHAKFYTLC